MGNKKNSEGKRKFHCSLDKWFDYARVLWFANNRSFFIEQMQLEKQKGLKINHSDMWKVKNG